MKVLFIVDSITKGGAGRVVSVLSDGMSNAGHGVSVLLMSENGPTGREYIKNENVKKLYLLKKAGEDMSPPKRIQRLRKIFKQEEPDVIIAFMTEYAEYTLLASRLLPVKVIVSERNDPHIDPTNKVIRILRNPLYRMADAIVLQTKAMYEYFPKYIQSKSTIIFNPINPYIPMPYNGERSKVFVSVGRLTKQKNYYMAIDAFSKFSAKHQDYRYEIYGSGSLQNELTSYIEKSNLNGKVELMGHVENVTNCIREKKALIISSDYEGLSNAMLEAAVLGLPIISTDRQIGDARMVIKDGVNGYLVPLKDSDYLSKKMEEIVTSDDLNKNAIREGLLLRQRILPETIIKEWLQVCKDIMERK